MKNKGLSKEDYFKKPLCEYTKWFYMFTSSVNLNNFSNLYQSSGRPLTQKFKPLIKDWNDFNLFESFTS